MGTSPRVDVVGTARNGVGVFGINFVPEGDYVSLLDGIAPGSILIVTGEIQSDCSFTPDAQVWMVNAYACGQPPAPKKLALDADLAALEARVEALENP